MIIFPHKIDDAVMMRSIHDILIYSELKMMMMYDEDSDRQEKKKNYTKLVLYLGEKGRAWNKIKK